MGNQAGKIAAPRASLFEPQQPIRLGNVLAASPIEDEVLDGDGDTSTLNVMVVGQTGVGKASLIRSLFGFDVLAGIDREAPSITCVKTRAVAPGADGSELDLEVIDTAGLGDNENFDMNLNTILTTLKTRLASHARQDTNINNALGRDDRVHLVLYVANPHRFTDTDRLYVTALSKYANVAVVHTKHDLVNREEADANKLQVRSALNRHAEATLRHSELLHDGHLLFGQEGFPYGVVCGEREYVWTNSAANGEDMRYSDLQLLRHEIMGPKMLDLKDKTELLYAHLFNSGEFARPVHKSWKPWAGLVGGYVVGEMYNRRSQDHEPSATSSNQLVGALAGSALGVLHHVMYGKL